jgi:hypothetical protein
VVGNSVMYPENVNPVWWLLQWISLLVFVYDIFAVHFYLSWIPYIFVNVKSLKMGNETFCSVTHGISLLNK